MGSAELAAFLFEPASEERLEILDRLASGPLPHRELATWLGRSGSETSRHLGRLVAAGLISKTSRRGYALTPLAEVARTALPFWEFLVVHREFLLDHDLRAIDPRLVARLGELRSATFLDGGDIVSGAIGDVLHAVSDRAWVATGRWAGRVGTALKERAASGVDTRLIRPGTPPRPDRAGPRRARPADPVRYAARLDVFVAILDDQAVLALPTRRGTVDLGRALLLRDPAGRSWVEELFERTWREAVPRDTPTAGTAGTPPYSRPAPVVGPTATASPVRLSPRRDAVADLAL